VNRSAAKERLPEIVAAMIEREDGLPCGRCSGRHVRTAQELRSVERACTCRCCHGAFAEWFEADFPDLITTRGGVRVVTQAAVEESIRRTEAEIASLEGARPSA
jgi:hypothetical protein